MEVKKNGSEVADGNEVKYVSKVGNQSEVKIKNGSGHEVKMFYDGHIYVLYYGRT